VTDEEVVPEAELRALVAQSFKPGLKVDLQFHRNRKGKEHIVLAFPDGSVVEIRGRGVGGARIALRDWFIG
jgi:hypothetical protein